MINTIGGIDYYSWFPDPNNIFDYKNLKPIWELLKLIDSWKEFGNIYWLDDEDIENIKKWYENYKLLYSYRPSSDRVYTKQQREKFKNLDKSKWKYDLMNLVEISIGRLLEKSFMDNWDEVRIRKTTTYDDVNSWLDYVIEFFDDDWKVSNVVWVDLTVSEKQWDSLYKTHKKVSSPVEYLSYLAKKNSIKLNSIPRVVITIDRDLAYSFTNNYFIDIVEKWNILSADDLESCFLYAVEDLKQVKDTNVWETTVSRLVEAVVSKSNELLFDKNWNYEQNRR